MPHPFSRGLNTILDPTGNTPLDDHYFIDSVLGSDATPDGTNPETPFQTVSAAIIAAGANNRYYVILEGEYAESTLPLPVGTTVLLGDGNVKFKGTGVERLVNMGTSSHNLVMDNIDVENYEYAYFSTSGNRFPRFINCSFIDADFFGSRGSNLLSCTFDGCLFVNVTSNMTDTRTSQTATQLGYIVLLANSGYNNCTFINSSFEDVIAGDPSPMNFISCDVDANSFIHIAYAITNVVRSCNIRGPVSASSTTLNDYNAYPDLASAQAAFPSAFDSCFDADPQYVDVSRFVLALQSGSPNILAGKASNYSLQNFNIGNAVVSDLSYFQGQSPLDNAVANNPNVSYNGLGELINTSGQDQRIELPEVELTNVELIGPFSLTGFSDPGKVEFELNWALPDRVYQPSFKKFRLDEDPTLDDNGNSNAELAFTEGDFDRIPAKYFIPALILKA